VTLTRRCSARGGGRRWSALVATAATLLAAGCSESSAPHRVAAGVYIISGSGATDTVLSALPQPLVVEVRDSALNGVPNETVTFQTVIGEAAYPGVAVSSAFTYTSTVTTDSRGQASLRVTLGTAAGAAAIAVSAASGGRVDTAHYTVRPGAPVGVTAIPGDTAVYVGHTFVLRGGVTDQFFNVVSHVATYSAPSAEISISSGVLSGVRIGRGSYVVSGAVAGVTKSDTGWVSVVPQGVLAASDFGNIYVFNTDGSNFHRVLAAINSDPRWSSTGNEIAYDETFNGAQDADLVGLDSVIHATDTAGHVRAITSPAIGGVHQAPAYSHDGQWVYFGRYPGNFQGSPRGSPTLWRVHPDGSGAEAVTVAVSGPYAFPSPSVDGSQIAFENLSESSDNLVNSLSVATGTLSGLTPVGQQPVWSPVSDSVAYTQGPGAGNIQGPLFVAAADGSGQRQVGTDVFQAGIDWSPDGMWIVGYSTHGFRIEIVNVSSGLRLPLSFLPTNLFSPTWKP
jgi:Tol biopolymer transport system component